MSALLSTLKFLPPLEMVYNLVMASILMASAKDNLLLGNCEDSFFFVVAVAVFSDQN